MDLQRKSVASLSGRVSFKQITGILLPELINSLSDKIQVASEDELLEYHKSLTELLIFRGGMPLSLLAKSTVESLQERSEIIDTYVKNDIKKYGLNVDSATLERCLRHIAMVNGKQFEIGTFTSKLTTNRQRVQDSISALEQLLLLRVIDPWGEINGRSVKVSKHTKLYIRDSGLLVSLLRFKTPRSLLGSRHIGTIWESFVIESLIGAAQSTGYFENCYYYRTHDGNSKLDLVLEFTDETVWGIEIKYSQSNCLNAGNIEAAENVSAKKRLVIHNGTKSFKTYGDFEAMPLNIALTAIREWKPDWTI